MLYFAHAPTFLIEHLVVHDAADSEFRIFLDGIILQVFISSVAVEEITPVRIAFADAAAQRQCHSSGLDIERFVVFDDTNRFSGVQRRGINVDGLEKQSETERFEECSTLLKIGATAKIQNEGF